MMTTVMVMTEPVTRVQTCEELSQGQTQRLLTKSLVGYPVLYADQTFFTLLVQCLCATLRHGNSFPMYTQVSKSGWERKEKRGPHVVCKGMEDSDF